MKERAVLLSVRVVVALVWLYNGLILKILFVDPEHLALVQEATREMGVPARGMLAVIGAMETVLALWIASGLRYRWAMGTQMVVVLALNAGGIFLGGMDDPLGLLVGNLPLLACGLVGIVFGPGTAPRRDAA